MNTVKHPVEPSFDSNKQSFVLILLLHCIHTPSQDILKTAHTVYYHQTKLNQHKQHHILDVLSS